MLKSLAGSARIVVTLSAEARRQHLSDSAWARLAGLPRESLSRLRGRKDCDWSTLDRLAVALGQQLGVSPADEATVTPDGHLPIALTRAQEERLRQLIAHGDFSPAAWRLQGPAFFMAGLAVLLGCCREFDRPRMLDLAEALHPGISEPAVFSLWLQRSPLEPSRFLAQLQADLSHASRR